MQSNEEKFRRHLESILKLASIERKIEQLNLKLLKLESKKTNTK